MSRRILPIAVLLAVPAFVWSGAQGTNPFRTAKVGQFVTYKMSVQLMGKDLESDVKQVVVAKDDKSVTVASSVTSMGKSFPGPKKTIDLTKPYDPISDAKTLGKAKLKITEEKKTSITVAGKKYDCTMKTGNVDGKAEVTVWITDAVPLGGLLKMQTKAPFGTITMEYAGTGMEKEKSTNE